MAWYVEDDSKPFRAAEALCTEPSKRGRVLPDKIEGHRVGWIRSSRMLWVEGHPSFTKERLAKPGEIPEALRRITGGLVDVGIEPESRRVTFRDQLLDARPTDGNGLAGLRRLDTTVDLACERKEGLAILTGIAALSLPRIKTQVIRQAGARAVETVELRGHAGRQILGRWYDKGVESGRANRGQLIRPEDQRRFPKQARPALQAVAESTYVRDSFQRRFLPLYRATEGVTVGSASELATKLARLQEKGAITPRRARVLAGHLLLDSADADHGPERTRFWHRSEARRLGLVLADGVLDEVQVDLHGVMEQVLEGEVWRG